MNLIDNVLLNNMASNADKQFAGICKRMSDLDEKFMHKMGGTSMVKLILSVLGNVCWGAGMIYLYVNYLSKSNVNHTLALAALGGTLFLIALMLFDGIVTYRYYGRIVGYDKELRDMAGRVNNDKASLSAKAKAFLQLESKKWDHKLSIGESIPSKVANLENALGRMNRVTSGFLQKLKVVLYYVMSMVITVVGCKYFYGTALKIMKIFGFSLSDKTNNVLFWIAVVVSCIGEYFVAEFLYSFFDCKVSNLSFIAMFAGMLLFLAITFVGSLFVWLLAIAISLIITIGAIILGGACICGFFSGG